MCTDVDSHLQPTDGHLRSPMEKCVLLNKLHFQSHVCPEGILKMYLKMEIKSTTFFLYNCVKFTDDIQRFLRTGTISKIILKLYQGKINK